VNNSNVSVPAVGASFAGPCDKQFELERRFPFVLRRGISFDVVQLTGAVGDRYSPMKSSVRRSRPTVLRNSTVNVRYPRLTYVRWLAVSSKSTAQIKCKKTNKETQTN